jgi:hypothetical protein
MSPFLGAEIEGVNLCGALSSEMYAAINNALLEHIVVIVRDQKLSPKAYVEVMSQFGVPGKQSHEYRKDKRPFHPSPTADDCCCIARQLCNTSPNPAAVEVAALKSSPLPGNHRPLPPFVTTNPCCGGASAASWMQPGHFKTCQPTCPWVSPTGGARLSGKTTDSLVWAFCLR